MADDLHYVPGDNYLLDDISGFKIRARDARIIPGGQTGGLAVSPDRWEPQQPQDFVRGVMDDQVASLVRSRQKDQFVVVGTQVAAPASKGDLSITVDSATNFTAGMRLQIMLDSGENFVTTLEQITGTTFLLLAPLPYSVGALYGDPIENAVLALGP